ncbi:unnamed protein product [Darwinula stevensoni]|uniref:Transposase n=1 Tax=Darwinula stevensoni TaxID=69355 RepID=A0A7R8XGY9_9CRUS|nr:unnamed protein product [Darwinula stevensoni]CAG0892221.1 unnamed protein product [Darwinula stevensoni]
MEDIKDHPCSELSIRTILFIAGHVTRRSDSQEWLASMLSSKREETLVEWRNFIRELLYRKLESAPPMGGPGQIVEIDESCFRGRRKNNKGWLMAGNNSPPRSSELR